MEDSPVKVCAKRHVAHFKNVVFGSRPLSQLSYTHVFSNAADSFFAVSLAGSLFFNVSLDAARPRILLYLLVTMAPFAVVASGVGPVIDRVHGGQRLVVALTLVLRAVLCLLLAGDVHSLLFYPEAFSLLVLGKTYSVAKSALVPRLVPDPTELVSANSVLARSGAVASAIGGSTALGVMRVADASWVLRAGGLVFLIGAFVALRLPRPRPAPRVSRALEYEELHSPILVQAAIATAALRAGVGYIVFLIGFALKRSGAGVTLFGVVIVSGGIGAFVGSLIAPRLRRRFGEEIMLGLALVLPAIVALAAAADFQAPFIIASAFVFGMSANIGRHAFDSMVQWRAPDADRGRAFARYETMFQLAWVAGAAAPVALSTAPALGLVVAALVLFCVAVFTTYRVSHSLANEPDVAMLRARVISALDGVEPPTGTPDERTLDYARWLADERASRQAILTAYLALDVSIERTLNRHLVELGMDDVDVGRFMGDQGRDLYDRLGEPLRAAIGWSPMDIPALRTNWFELQRLRRAAILDGAEPTLGDARRSIELVCGLVTVVAEHAWTPQVSSVADSKRDARSVRDV